MRQIITFKILSLEDCDQLHHWLQMNHVKDFWDDGDRTVEQVKEHYFNSSNVKHYLFFIGENAAGFIQSYYIDQADEYAKFTLPGQTNIGIDFFIGNEKFLNQGLATQILEEFISTCCQDAERVIVDPEPINHKAIHIYKKYGFIKIGNYISQHKSHDIMAINVRRTARAVILNLKNEVLLMQIQGGPTEGKKRNSSAPFWVTLGGKIEKNESAELALLRELREEAGVKKCKKYQLIAFGEQVLQWNAFPTRLIEKFYFVHTDTISLHDKKLSEEEIPLVKDYRWWPLPELEETKQIVYPPCLARLIKEYQAYPCDWNARLINLN